MKILLTLLGSLFVLNVQAETTFEHFTGEDEWPVFGEYPNLLPNIINPGEFFCTGGGEPIGLFECDGDKGIHIRGTEMMSCSVNLIPDDGGRLTGTIWFDINANWDANYTGPVSGNWRIVPSLGCDWSFLINPQTFWQGTYTGRRELVTDSTWVTTLKLVGYGIGDVAGQQLKATEVITTFTPIPLPWELLGAGLVGPEGYVEITIITE
jgi:hypothetical protein